MKIKAETDRLNETEITDHIKTKWAGKKVVFYEETASTNVEAVKLACEGAGHGTLVVTGNQTAGKGRRGRVWQSEENGSIAMSMILKPGIEPEAAPMLTLVQAMATAKAMEEVCGVKAEIKWPNDILVKEKKVCGILTEMHLEKTKISSIIIGTGINVNQDKFPEEIAGIATSLKKETKKLQSRVELICRICQLFESYYEEFLEKENVSGFLKEYNSRLVSLERRVRVLEPKGEFEGTALGINTKGELLVEKDDGEVVKVYAGEVSVRGIYGYV